MTVADLAEFNIGAAFWGLVAGTAVSRLLERSDFHLRGLGQRPLQILRYRSTLEAHCWCDTVIV